MKANQLSSYSMDVKLQWTVHTAVNFSGRIGRAMTWVAFATGGSPMRILPLRMRDRECAR